MSITHTCLVPCFDTPGGHLIEAVNSLLYQNGVETTVLVINDGSTRDDTIEALKMLACHPRVRVHHLHSNTGTPAALNFGHAMIDTQYTVLMGGDDISHPDRLRHQIAYLEANPKTDVLGTGLWAFKDVGSSFRAKWFGFEHPEVPRPKMYPGVHDAYFLVNHGTVMYRNSAVKDVNGYDESKRRGQDVELWRRMHGAGKVFRNVTKVLYAFRRVGY